MCLCDSSLRRGCCSLTSSGLQREQSTQSTRSGSKTCSGPWGSRIEGGVAMPTVRTADGVNLSYHALGEGRAQVLFMPGRGGAGSGLSWKEVVKHLDVTGLRRTLADLPGHCQSEKATNRLHH